ncbi:unnamed protein product [Brachionus calyciflorus]|uniref:polyribonucleotide nucleotidyltransferase n=1 Tax=Brachionus calyciflorus TaxID=104777 RepID=A0A814BJW3_9BILA|nr:unnamed protein product [Brachionus calyciflorus]
MEPFKTNGNKKNMNSLKMKYQTGTLELNHRTLARLADSSATGQFNGTNILVTVVNKPRLSPASFLPLTFLYFRVDYLHKASAAGKIPTNFLRRDLGASNYEILVSRMIDRSIRPLFSTNYNNEIQIVCNLLAYDGKDNPDVVCINAASFALYGSSCEWNGPIGSVRVGMVDNEFVANPSRKQLEDSPLNIVLSVGPSKNIVMIEGWADNLDQNKFTDALEFGAEHAYKVVEEIKRLKLNRENRNVKKDTSLLSVTSEDEAIDGKQVSFTEIETPKQSIEPTSTQEIENVFQALAYSHLYDIFTDYEHDKISRDNAITQVKNSVINSIQKSSLNPDEISPGSSYSYSALNEIFYKFVRKVVRDLALNESKRVDGRKLHELRPISCKSNLYPSLHGSGLFQRGQTQVLCSVTFDSPDSMYKSDAVANMMSPSLTNFNKNFMLHYEFPSFATNEIARIGGRADRREIGHGALAEKSLYPLLPADFPLTVRCLCEVLESNGSSSMASVCASSMALLDAGVPIKEQVAGVAMGIFTDFDEYKNIKKYKILTDISGFEDYMGDMDFKIAGTNEGVTAPRENKKSNQPILKNYPVSIVQRSKLIGIGGMNLKKIYSKTGVTVNPVDETNFSIFSPNENALKEAEKMIKSFIEESKEPQLEFGGIYKAKIVEIVPSGLMVQLYPTMKPTLLPNSQLDGRKIVHGSASDYKVGQEIQIKYFGRDPVDGKMRISRKALFKTSSPAQDLLRSTNPDQS